MSRVEPPTPEEAIELFGALVIYVTEFGENDPSDCEYFRGIGSCSYECGNKPNPEPECMTMRPGWGWPMEDVSDGLRARVEEAAGLTS